LTKLQVVSRQTHEGEVSSSDGRDKLRNTRWECEYRPLFIHTYRRQAPQANIWYPPLRQDEGDPRVHNSGYGPEPAIMWC